jgi:hypothetical protein
MLDAAYRTEFSGRGTIWLLIPGQRRDLVIFTFRRYGDGHGEPVGLRWRFGQ